MTVTFNDNRQEAKEKLKQNILRACEAVGLYVEGESKKLSPIDTGNLRGSIEHDSDAEQGIARIGTNVASTIHSATEKASIVDNDELTIVDSENANTLKKVLFSTVKTAKQNFKIKIFISKYKLIERFTDVEWAKIVGFQMIIDASSLTEQEKFERKLTMNALLKKLELSNEINLLDRKAESMGAILVDYGFITHDRIKEVLTI